MLRQKLPKEKIQRESLREKGQFWTPDWVSRCMIKYVVSEQTSTIFDPAVGGGAFFQAAYDIDKTITRTGMDNDSAILPKRFQKDNVKIGDFMLENSFSKKLSIVCNPPYKRHHRLEQKYKKLINKRCSKIIGAKIDGRAGLQVYFLIKALTMLGDNGKLSFIISSDVCEGKFSKPLCDWISTNFRIETIILFNQNSSPFEADINPIIFNIKKTKQAKKFRRITCLKMGTNQLELAISKSAKKFTDLDVEDTNLENAIQAGLSRRSVTDPGIRLEKFATVNRGIATGANKFFHLTHSNAVKLGLLNFTIPAINRTRDLPCDVFTKTGLKKLERKGRPTLLLSLTGKEKDRNVIKYIKKAEKSGLHKKPLVASRKIWYKMEYRQPPDLIFTYLGRRNNRFILNNAGVVPLNTFHCVYSLKSKNKRKLFKALNDPRTVKNLPMVAKSYGSGSLKVEPNSLENLVIPHSVIRENRL